MAGSHQEKPPKFRLRTLRFDPVLRQTNVKPKKTNYVEPDKIAGNKNKTHTRLPVRTHLPSPICPLVRSSALLHLEVRQLLGHQPQRGEAVGEHAQGHAPEPRGDLEPGAKRFFWTQTRSARFARLEYGYPDDFLL